MHWYTILFCVVLYILLSILFATLSSVIFDLDDDAAAWTGLAWPLELAVLVVCFIAGTASCIISVPFVWLNRLVKSAMKGIVHHDDNVRI